MVLTGDCKVGKSELVRWAARWTRRDLKTFDDVRGGAIFVEAYAVAFPLAVERRLSIHSKAHQHNTAEVPAYAAWDVLRGVFNDLHLPISILDVAGCKAGRFRACHSLLVLPYFASKLARVSPGQAFTCEFAHPVDSALADFLASPRLVQALRRGGGVPPRPEPAAAPETPEASLPPKNPHSKRNQSLARLRAVKKQSARNRSSGQGHPEKPTRDVSCGPAAAAAAAADVATSGLPPAAAAPPPGNEAPADDVRSRRASESVSECLRGSPRASMSDPGTEEAGKEAAKGDPGAANAGAPQQLQHPQEQQLQHHQQQESGEGEGEGLEGGHGSGSVLVGGNAAANGSGEGHSELRAEEREEEDGEEKGEEKGQGSDSGPQEFVRVLQELLAGLNRIEQQAGDAAPAAATVPQGASPESPENSDEEEGAAEAAEEGATEASERRETADLEGAEEGSGTDPQADNSNGGGRLYFLSEVDPMSPTVRSVGSPMPSPGVCPAAPGFLPPAVDLQLSSQDNPLFVAAAVEPEAKEARESPERTDGNQAAADPLLGPFWLVVPRLRATADEMEALLTQQDELQHPAEEAAEGCRALLRNLLIHLEGVVGPTETNEGRREIAPRLLLPEVAAPEHNNNSAPPVDLLSFSEILQEALGGEAAASVALQAQSGRPPQGEEEEEEEEHRVAFAADLLNIAEGRSPPGTPRTDAGTPRSVSGRSTPPAGAFYSRRTTNSPTPNHQHSRSAGSYSDLVDAASASPHRGRSGSVTPEPMARMRHLSNLKQSTSNASLPYTVQSPASTPMARSSPAHSRGTSMGHLQRQMSARELLSSSMETGVDALALWNALTGSAEEELTDDHIHVHIHSASFEVPPQLEAEPEQQWPLPLMGGSAQTTTTQLQERETSIHLNKEAPPSAIPVLPDDSAAFRDSKSSGSIDLSAFSAFQSEGGISREELFDRSLHDALERSLSTLQASMIQQQQTQEESSPAP